MADFAGWIWDIVKIVFETIAKIFLECWHFSPLFALLGFLLTVAYLLKWAEFEDRPIYRGHDLRSRMRSVGAIALYYCFWAPNRVRRALDAWLPDFFFKSLLLSALMFVVIVGFTTYALGGIGNLVWAKVVGSTSQPAAVSGD